MARKVTRELAFGLDFGTTQSYLAYLPRDGKGNVQLANCNPRPDELNAHEPADMSMPSEVFLRRNLAGNASEIVLEIGRPRDLVLDDYVPLARFKADLDKSREMQHGRKEYKLRPAAPDQPAEYVEPEAVTGFLMWRMRQLALQSYEVKGQTDAVDINNITVTVPALSSSVQRKATQFAARLAGFEGEIYTLEEPVAAFLYHYSRFDKEFLRAWRDAFVLVFDFGGGTCDLSLIRLNGRSLPNVVGRTSAQVGGENVDELIARLWLKRMKLKERRRFEELGHNDQYRLRRFARTAKEQLSGSDPASVTIGTLSESQANIGDRSLDRQTLAELLAREPILTSDANEAATESTVLGLVSELVEELLRKAGVGYDRIESVILAGGSSKLSAVRECLHAKFPDLGDRFISKQPETSIAMGAALHQYFRHAGDKTMRKLVEPTLAQEIRLDHSFDSGTATYRHSVVLGEQNHRLPIERSKRNPLFLVDALPVGNVVKMRLRQVGSRKSTTLLTDGIKVRSKDDHVLQIHYRITDYGIIEDFVCLPGSIKRPPFWTRIVKPDLTHEIEIVEESEEHRSLLENYDLDNSARIGSLRQKYRIHVDK